MNNDVIKTIGYIIIIAAIGFVIGYFSGKGKTEVKPKIEYVKGDTIHDSIYIPKPIKVIEPIDTASIIEACIKDSIYFDLFPTKIIEKPIYVPEKEDTSAILKDWATTRLYSEVLFNSDTLGKFTFNAQVKYNRLQSYSYDFNPIYKNTTIEKVKVPFLTPFVGGGVSSMPSIIIQGGFFIKQKYGITGIYQYDFNLKKNYIGGVLLYSF